jgi:hypothetical protein
VPLYDFKSRTRSVASGIDRYGNSVGVATVDAVPDQHAERRKGRAFREVQPLQEFAPLRRSHARRQPAGSVLFEDVFEDGAGLTDHELAVDEHREAAEGRRLRKRGLLRPELDPLQLVRQLQLFEQPANTNRARARGVVELQHEP